VRIGGRIPISCLYAKSLAELPSVHVGLLFRAPSTRWVAHISPIKIAHRLPSVGGGGLGGAPRLAVFETWDAASVFTSAI